MRPPQENEAFDPNTVSQAFTACFLFGILLPLRPGLWLKRPGSPQVDTPRRFDSMGAPIL
jgi:hypothetical protein